MNDNRAMVAFATMGVSLLTAYFGLVDAKYDTRKTIPGVLMLGLSGYLTYIQFQEAKKEILIAQAEKKLGSIQINQGIA
jgi:hypothetical protein